MEIIQVRDACGFHQGGKTGGMEKWYDSEYIWELEIIGFVIRLAMGLRES